MTRLFAEPSTLWALLMIPLVLLGRRRARRRRGGDWRALGQSSLPVGKGSGAWLLAWGCLIVALAGPRWGRRAGDEPLAGHDLALLLDVSRSMGAEDAFPNRLALASDAARSLLGPLRDEPGDRAAVVAFAGRAVVRCPLTTNLAAAADALDGLRAGGIEPGGTDLGAGLDAALDILEGDGRAPHPEGRAIVVFSDGEDHAATWPEVVARLVGANVVVHVVAVGDPDRALPVPALAAAGGDPPPMTRRTDAALRQLADATGGAFVPLGVAHADLGTLYHDRIEPTTRVARVEPVFAERAERFGVFLSVALGAGLLGSRTPRRVRRRFGGLGAGDLLRTALVAGGIGSLIALLLGARPVASAGGPARAEAATRRGLRAFEDGRFAVALDEFEAARRARPAGAIAPFDAGSALFALGRFDEAEERYREAQGLAGRDLRPKVDYSLGNTAAMLGRFAEAVARYDACLAAEPTSEALRSDAALNREYVLARLRAGADDSKRDPPPDGGAGNDPPDGGRPGPDPTDPADAGGAPPGAGAPPARSDRSGSGGPSGRRGPGGAGGSGSAPEEVSPDAQLNAALRQIRAAKEQQPADPPPRPPRTPPNAAARDW